MSDRISGQKAILRKEMRDRLKRLSAEERNCAATGLEEKLRDLNELSRSLHVLGFIPHGNEINCSPFCDYWLGKGHKLSYPVVDTSQDVINPHEVCESSIIAAGYRGIREPRGCPMTPLALIDAILIPGLAFDARGHRLGQGGGHYDRLLVRRPESCATIGLAYDWQVVDHVPVDVHDQLIQWIVTPTRIIDCRI
ncbi:5-formyltetrahydrofolate cyclo-ligase [Candidatus Sumerlaeota bacterium]|nr:5-formyltetrahydrofolate cyclo-ligase [Candidatus Sumerlaeota bacterium]